MTDVSTTEREALEKKFVNLRRMVNQLSTEVDLEGPAFDVDAFMERILSGETEEEVFEAQELGSIATQDYLGKPFFLRPDDVKWMRSTIEDAARWFPFYAFLKVRDLESGEMVSLNGGGTSFVTVLWRLLDMGAFNGFEDDGRAFVLEGKKTGKGFDVVLLKPYKLPKTAKGK